VSVKHADNLNEFYEALDAVCQPQILGVSLRPADKSTRQQLLDTYQHDMAEQLRTNDTDLASALLAACLYLFVKQLSTSVYATGKYVPMLVSRLRREVVRVLCRTHARVRAQVSPVCATLLVQAQSQVVARLRSQIDNDNTLVETLQELKTSVLSE
jgi:hypothetical protein